MRSRFQFTAYAWIIVVLCSSGFLFWSNLERAKRVDYITNTGASEAVVDAHSPTGYAQGKRWLIVPQRNDHSYELIAETQQMLAGGEWRVRHIDYDNAPFGRTIHSASLYRWWLGLIATCDRFATGRPIGISVEKAALYADPIIHLLLLLGTTVFIARYFGSAPAALVGIGLTTAFPFAGEFLPGMPDEHGLSLGFSLLSILPLIVAAMADLSVSRRIEAPPAAAAGKTRLFFIAGIAGGIGLWNSAASEAPVLIGIALGGLLASLADRRRTEKASTPSPLTPWRAWALGGAATCLAAYMIEYFPGQMEFRLEVNHPLYGLAWIGMGELLTQWEGGFRPRSVWNYRRICILILATAALAALPIAMGLTKTPSLLLGDPLASRLSVLPNPVVAKNLFAWIIRDGFTPAFVVTCLPLLLLGAAAWQLTRSSTDSSRRRALLIAVGPVAVSLFLAYQQLRWWSLCDALLIVLIVPLTAMHSNLSRWWYSVFVGMIFLPGLAELIPAVATRDNIVFNRSEVEALIERDLAHWISDHADPPGAVILVPPNRTTSWCFHGGMKGLGSTNWENRDGLAATVRIATATTEGEAFSLIGVRGVTHIILPSWDSDLDEFARWSLPNPEDAFVMALHHWALPNWLRPLPYKLPSNVGFDGQSVAIFEVTDESNRATALGRLAEYFVESQQIDLAASVAKSLERYPTDLGALVALGEVEKARGDADAFAKTLETLSSSLASGGDRALAWDRRVSLGVALAQGGRNDLARVQIQRCLEKINATRIRSLTTGSLFRLQVLAKAFGLEISDQQLRALAVQLLPPELRERL